MPSSGTIIAQYSDASSDYDIGKLVDDNVNTKYLTYHSSFDITWNGNSSIAVESYSLTSAVDSPEMDPKSWTLSGSTDGKSWKVISTCDNEVFSERKETKTYEIEESYAYRYYKLSIKSNNGGSATQIAEWTLSATKFDGNIDDLRHYFEDITDSEKTPMGKYNENKKVATVADLEWLSDPAKEPKTFGKFNWSTYNITTLYPYGDPSPADCNQTALNDCSLVAVFAEMAYLYPKFMKSIIKENPDKSFTVSVFDPQGKPIKVGVSNRFFGDGTSLNATAGKHSKVTWATVMEKAVMKWKEMFDGSSNIGGIGTQGVTAIFTGSGNTFRIAPGKMSPKDFQRVVRVSLNQRKIVIGGFNKGGIKVQKDLDTEEHNQTVTAHAFSFSLAPVDKPYLFGMRNPWGGSSRDGLMYVTDDGEIPQLIDLRICDSGVAKAFAVGNLEPYIPPTW